MASAPLVEGLIVSFVLSWPGILAISLPTSLIAVAVAVHPTDGQKQAAQKRPTAKWKTVLFVALSIAWIVLGAYYL